MNFKHFMPIAAVTLFAASCAQPDKTIEHPFIEAANTMSLDIAKVELSDTATVLHTDAYYRPHYWIKISSESYLLADGKKYALKGTEGIQADSLFWMPESGEASFRLRFEPLPKNTKSFDFIESDCDECFKLYGISLTSSQTAEYGKPEEVPAELLQTDPNTSVPEPIFKIGESTVNIHLAGYREGMGKELNLYVNTMFGRQESYTAPIDETTGTATVKFLQCGPAQALIVFNMDGQNAWLAPGENTDIYIDLRTSGRRILARRAEKKHTPQPSELQSVYVSGSYRNLNNAVHAQSHNTSFDMNLYSGTFADYRMKAGEYAEHVSELYKKLADSITCSQLPQLQKEINLINLKQETLAAITMGDRIREHNYRYTNNMWEPSQKVKGIDPIKPEHIATVCGLFDINDPKLLMGINTSYYVGATATLGATNPQLLLQKKGLAYDLYTVNHFPEKAESATLTEKDFQILKGMDNPFYLETFEKLQNKTKEQLAALADKAVIEQTPNVPKEKLLEAIIAPYKGKVVLIDFWNTWCAPCRMSIKANEPLKENELKSDKLIWIYIANESSPMVKYQSMIVNIKGKHFRLNDEQWMYITDKLKIDGIPSYVLVEPSGEYKLRNDFRDHELMKNTLKDMIQ